MQDIKQIILKMDMIYFFFHRRFLSSSLFVVRWKVSLCLSGADMFIQGRISGFPAAAMTAQRFSIITIQILDFRNV